MSPILSCTVPHCDGLMQFIYNCINEGLNIPNTGQVHQCRQVLWVDSYPPTLVEFVPVDDEDRERINGSEEGKRERREDRRVASCISPSIPFCAIIVAQSLPFLIAQ